MTVKKFQKLIYSYYKVHGRHDLPWRKTHDPYKIMVSEIMLQQTQVDRVKEKYLTFIKKFPTSKDLHEASVAQVLKLWQGLGYNRRAINLKKAADSIVVNHDGTMPEVYDLLLELPGIGPYTARAILTFAYNKPGVFIETNIRTVFIHHFFKNKKNVHDNELIPMIEKMQDEKNPREWYAALMDYGSYLKKEVGNVNRVSRHYTKQSTFEGSDRQVRGEILKYLIDQNKSTTQKSIFKALQRPKKKVEEKIEELIHEGFITKKNNQVKII